MFFRRGLARISARVTGRASFRFRDKIDRAPIAFLRGRIGICCSLDLRNSDDRLFRDAMIKENFVSLGHGAQIIARGVIAHAGPTR